MREVLCRTVIHTHSQLNVPLFGGLILGLIGCACDVNPDGDLDMTVG